MRPQLARAYQPFDWRATIKKIGSQEGALAERGNAFAIMATYCDGVR
jgi:hypothetical protein